jgi:hypothetical protein
MDNAREVGSDRIVNALAAAQLFGGPSIVVDFGTATTSDVVSARESTAVGRMLAEECTCFTARQPWLTLLGLEIVYSRKS